MTAGLVRHILVVDDDAAVADVIAATLESAGTYRASHAADADRARAAMQRELPDGAVVDATVSRGAGLAVAAELLALGIGVVITTGDPAHMVLLDGAACRFLRKPFRIAELLAELGEALAAEASRRAELAGNLARARSGPSRPHSSAAGAPPSAAYDAIIDAVLAETGTEMMTMQMLEPGGVLRLVASRGFSRDFDGFFALVRPDDDSACGAALRTADRVIVPDVATSPIFAGKPSGDALRQEGVRAVVSTPIAAPPAGVVGMLSVHRRRVWSPSPRELAALDRSAERLAARIAPRGGDAKRPPGG